MKEYDKNLFLVLGCNGRADDGFVTCSSASNAILLISNKIEGYDHLIKYLQMVSLFDKKIIDYNGIRNVLFKMNKGFMQGHKTLWGDRLFPLIEHFTLMHRPCGIYLSLEFLNKTICKNPTIERTVVIEPKTI